MAGKPVWEYRCQVCGGVYPPSEVLPSGMMRGALRDVLIARHPEWSDDGYICLDDVNRLRRDYITDSLAVEARDLQQVQASFREGLNQIDAIARDLNTEYADRLTTGERLADRLAELGGSWPFLITFVAITVIWIIINSLQLLRRPFDPYPYILLNLVLSSLSAIQAPVILMSQNRQEAKDRQRAKQDLHTNLRAEVEIRALNDKIDQLLTHQWHRLLEIQQMQLEMMEELLKPTRDAQEKPPQDEQGEAA